MTMQEMIDGLSALGFTGGFAIGGNPAEIILWENTEPQPTNKAIEAAAAQGAYERELVEIEHKRQAAYQAESDPLFFKYQRDEDGATKQAWLDKIEEIRARYPMPEPPVK